MAAVSTPPEPGADGPTDTPPAKTGAADNASPTAGVSQVTGEHVRQAAVAAATWLEFQAAAVDALNVYPVPDGDTGTNMSMTMRAAAEAAAVEPSGEAYAVARAAARGALMGARGNSGVILSQLVRGFAEALGDRAALNVQQIADGLEGAAQAGYRAVGKPGS